MASSNAAQRAYLTLFVQICGLPWLCCLYKAITDEKHYTDIARDIAKIQHRCHHHGTCKRKYVSRMCPVCVPYVSPLGRNTSMSSVPSMVSHFDININQAL